MVGSVPPGMASGCLRVTSSVTLSDWEKGTSTISNNLPSSIQSWNCLSLEFGTDAPTRLADQSPKHAPITAPTRIVTACKGTAPGG